MIPQSSILRNLKLSESSAAPDHVQIARQIEQWIRVGQLREGERLPPTNILAKQWRIHNGQIQRSMEILTKKGLLQRFPRRGTFVTSKSIRPSIGILVGPNLLAEETHFYRVLSEALKEQVTAHRYNARLYGSMSYQKSLDRKRSLEDLAYDLEHQRFIGFVIIGRGVISGSIKPIFEHPTVLFGTPSPKTAVDVAYDAYDFAFQSVRWLLDRGARKVTFIDNGVDEDTSYQLRRKGHCDAFTEKNLKVPKDSSLINLRTAFPPTEDARPKGDRFAFGVTQNVIARWNEQGYWPDGIVINDDINARGVIVAIRNALTPRRKPPLIVVLTTEGVDHFYALPAARYQVDANRLADALIQRLIARAIGEPEPADVQMVPGTIVDSYQ